MKLMFSMMTLLFVALQLSTAAANAGWELVFLADNGTGDNVYTKWVDPPSNPPHADTSCTCAWRQSVQCTNCTWKCNKVDAWSNVKEVIGLPKNSLFVHFQIVYFLPCIYHVFIEMWFQVKVVYYTNCKEVAFITFNAANTNKTNWFNVTRVTSSSWTSLNSTSSVYPQFGIAGDVDKTRRFFALQSYQVCGHDKIWMGVIDPGNIGLHPCNYDQRQGYPYFLYNPTGISSIVNDEKLLVADTFTIYIR
ncbi:uncharacterized protein LOC141900491 isoform X1 [Tubulanus polymorphus]|uniref:uncharacterized protein LOC141900491 isoform X1 n=1 Tax=Tubulanus polymorphus TaxID=672921 RepID=UPI003DA54943